MRPDQVSEFRFLFVFILFLFAYAQRKMNTIMAVSEFNQQCPTLFAAAIEKGHLAIPGWRIYPQTPEKEPQEEALCSRWPHLEWSFLITWWLMR